MKRKGLYFSICMVFVLSNMAAGVSASASLGQPGLSYRYVKTFGEIGLPYLVDTTHLNRPEGLFMDAGDHLYVAEEVGFRVLKYDAAGANEFALGQAGICGTEDYKFCRPQDGAMDAGGNFWVADGNRVAQYSAGGVFLQQFPVDDPWASGSDNGHFSEVHGVALDALGQLFVSDTANQRVQVFDMTGGSPAYSATIGVTGVPGSDDSHFNRPFRMAVDSTNNLYVVDRDNRRVQKCTLNGSWSCSLFVGSLSVPEGIAIDSSNNVVYVADPGVGSIIKCTPDATCSTFQTVIWSSDLAVDSSGNLFSALPNDMVVRKFDSNGNDLGTFLGVWRVPYLTDAGHFNHLGVAIDHADNILVIEENGQRLLKLDPTGNLLWTYGEPGIWLEDDLHFQNPIRVAVDKTNNVYVTSGCRVMIFSPDGAYLGSLGTGCGTGNYEFSWPTGVAVDDNGNIYVSDFYNHRVMAYNSSKTFIGQIGVTGECSPANGYFCNRVGLATDRAGNIYVAEKGNRVQKFNSRRQWQMNIGNGTWGNQFDQLSPPEDVAVDAQGKIYVADWTNNRIQVFDSTGAYLTTIGGAWGVSSGQVKGASGVDVDSQGNLYAVDYDNVRILKFAPGVSGWKQVNINGFGSPSVDQLASMAVFRDKLYAGTSNYTFNVHHIFSTRTGTNWQEGSQDFQSGVSVLKAFKGRLYAGTWTGLLWSSPDGEHWNNIFTSPSGFGNLSQYRGELYAGTYSDHNEGAAIYKSADGVNWTPFVTNGNGDPRASGVISAADFKGYHYFGIGDWEGTGGGRIWRTDGIRLKEVVGDGFGNPQNYAPGGLADLNGWLYASVNNPNSYQVWRSNSGNPGSWKMVLETGQVQPGINGHTGLIVYNNQIYLTTYNNWSGMQVWRSGDGVHWSQTGFGGFGDSNNQRTEWSNSLAVFNGQLYVGATNYANGVEVWQMLNQDHFLPDASGQILLPFILR